MIISTITSGLGNQLFQYAFARQLAVNNNTPLFLDTRFYRSAYAKESQRGFKLNNFAISYKELTRPVEYLIKFSKLFKGQTLHPVFSTLNEKYYHFDPVALAARDLHIIVKGYWHSEKYFKGAEALIRQELQFTNDPGPKFAFYKDAITLAEASVSIHVRRGDYVTHPEFSKTFGFAGLDYYDRAMGQISLSYPGCRFFVFTDDPVWVKENLKMSQDTVFVQNTGDLADIDDLHLMSLCKHNIIANSSYSWWGAWLNSNKNKTVMAPKKWYKNQPDWDTKDLLPEKWLAI